MLLSINNHRRGFKMDFERAVELRRQKRTYNEIGEILGCAGSAVRRRFVKEYELGNLLELSGYRAARPTDPRRGSDYHLRQGSVLPVGISIAKRLTTKEKLQVLDMMSAGRYRTMNDMLLAMLREKLGGHS